jgi:hypothetical protein
MLYATSIDFGGTTCLLRVVIFSLAVFAIMIPTIPVVAGEASMVMIVASVFMKVIFVYQYWMASKQAVDCGCST